MAKSVTEEEVMNLRAVYERREQKRASLTMSERLQDLVRTVVTDRRTGRTGRKRDRVVVVEMVPDANDDAANVDESTESEESDDEDETASS